MLKITFSSKNPGSYRSPLTARKIASSCLRFQSERRMNPKGMMPQWCSVAGNPAQRKHMKTYYYCGKLGHLACFCYNAKHKGIENTNNAKDDDEYTFTMQHKAHSKAMCTWIMLHFGRSFLVVGGKFISKEFKHFLKEHGMKKASTTYRPQQNGVAKCANCIIVEMAWNMLQIKNSTNHFGRKR